MIIEAMTGELPEVALRSLELREWREEEGETLAGLLDTHHYLGCPDRRRRHLCQVVSFEGKAVALLVWTTASGKLAGRETYVGWDARTRQKRLGWVVQNNRFLILPSKRPLNLASRVLGMAVKELPEAWERHHGKRPLLAETFVDPESYKGTCYRAAGWTPCGRTAGYSRVSGRDFYQDNERPKDLWLKPLGKDALERLRDPSRLLPAENPKARAPGALPIKAKEAESLRRALQAIKDPRSRKGQQFPLSALLTTTVLAMCCGATTVSDIFRFCQDLTSSQRRSLGFRPNPQAPRVVPPPGEGCWRKVLGAVDPDELARVLNAWMQAQRTSGELPALLSIDGKVIGNNLATLVSLVDARDGCPVAQAAAPGNGQEQRLTDKLIAALPEGALEGKSLSGDALYNNKNLIRTTVHERGGEVLVQLKANQKTTLEEATRRLHQDAPPFCTHPSS